MKITGNHLQRYKQIAKLMWKYGRSDLVNQMGIDETLDEADRAAGKKIACPLLAIWGTAGGVPAETEDPLAIWREWASDVRGFGIDCGHYLAEEAPEATARALVDFFSPSL